MTAEDYCTVAEVRNYIGIASSDSFGADDTAIGGFITNASRIVDAYALRQFASTESVVEWFDVSYGLQHLTLSKRPVASLTSVEEADGEGSLTALTIGRARGTDHCYLEDGDAGIISFHYPFTETLKQRVKVSYTTGVVLGSIPAEVKMATIMIAGRSTIRSALTDENCPDRLKEMWMPLLKSTDSEVQEMLNLVKRHRSLDVAVFGTHITDGVVWRTG